MEGTNSRLKCIIKNANGYRNFNRFRDRCFFAINKKMSLFQKIPKEKKTNNKLRFYVAKMSAVWLTFRLTPNNFIAIVDPQLFYNAQ